jgi:hypothetical protein
MTGRILHLGRTLAQRGRWLVIAAALALIGLQEAVPEARDGILATHADAAQPKSDPLEGGTAWLNTESPLALADLRGRVVLLDFWTLC